MKKKTTKKKTNKRKRLEPLARIRRRLMRLWTARVGDAWDHKCAVCGSASTPNAHHLENRNTCRALKFDPMNGILLCPSHHKFGKNSAHKGGIWFAEWLRTHYPMRYAYVLAHRDDEMNLNDRETLAMLEARLQPHSVCQPQTPDVKAEPEREPSGKEASLFNELDRLFASNHAPRPQRCPREWALFELVRGGKLVELSTTMPLSLFTTLKLSGSKERAKAAADLGRGGLLFMNKKTKESVDVTERWLLDEFFPRYDKEFQNEDGNAEEETK